MSVVDEIKSRLDIVEVIGGYVQLKKTGRTFKGLCPFHTEKTPSFLVNPDRQTWHCFGACSTGGDVFSFIQRAENVDFPEALRLLAERTGVELKPRTPQDQTEDEARQRLFDIHAVAAQLFYNHLVNAPAAAPARAYLHKRQLDDATRDRFGLGYALDSWDTLLETLTARGYRVEDIALAGLAVEREGGGYYDRFRGRVMFPIRDERGRVIGFGGRTLGDGTPKYLNSPQTPLFEKGNGLYALDVAKDAIRRSGVAVVVEGYMDVVSLHQRGFQNVVASLGTALTEAQVTLAARYAGKLVLALDADTAGNAATLRGLQVAAQAMATQKRRMPGQGGRLNTVEKRAVELRIAVLPAGLDPDDLVKQNPAEWERRITASKPVPDYYFTALVADLDLSAATGKEEAATRLLQVIRDELDSPVEQAHYLQWLARLTRVDERQLTQRFQAIRKTAPYLRPAVRPVEPEKPSLAEAPDGMPNDRPRPESRAAPRPTTPRVFGLEEHLLGVLLQSPDKLNEIQHWLIEQGMTPLAESDFSAADNQALFKALVGADDGPPQKADLSILDTHIDAIQRRLTGRPVVNEEAVPREALITLLRLREAQRRQELAQLSFLLADAHGEHDEAGASRYTVRVQHVSLDLERIRRALTQTQRFTVPIR